MTKGTECHDFHQVTKCNKWISEFTTSPKYLDNTFWTIFFCIFPETEKNKSLVTFTVCKWALQHCKRAKVHALEERAGKVIEKSQKCHRRLLLWWCFFGCPRIEKRASSKKNNTFFWILFWKLVGWLVSWKFVSFFSFFWGFLKLIQLQDFLEAPRIKKIQALPILANFQDTFCFKILWPLKWTKFVWFMSLYDSKYVSNTKFHLWHIRKEISAEVERPFAEDQSRRLGRVMSEKIWWPTKSLKLVDFYFNVDNNVNFFWGPYFYTQKNWVAEFGWYYVFFSEFFTEMLGGSPPFYGLLDAIKTPPTDINWLSSWSCLGILESIKFEHRCCDDILPEGPVVVIKF